MIKLDQNRDLSLRISILGFFLLYFAISILPYIESIFGRLTQFGELTILTALSIIILILSASGLICLHMIPAGWRRIPFIGAWGANAFLAWVNPLTVSPEQSFLGWLLFSLAIIGPYSFRDKKSMWSRLSWIVCASGYSYSAYTKLLTPSWLDGTAVKNILATPIASSWIKGNSLAPTEVLQFAGISVIVFELLVPLALLGRRAKCAVWCALMLFHLGNICFLSLEEVSLGMLLFHSFQTPDMISRGFVRLKAKISFNLGGLVRRLVCAVRARSSQDAR